MKKGKGHPQPLAACDSLTVYFDPAEISVYPFPHGPGFIILQQHRLVNSAFQVSGKERKTQ